MPRFLRIVGFVALLLMALNVSAAQPIATTVWLYDQGAGTMLQIAEGSGLSRTFALPQPEPRFDSMPARVIASPDGRTLAYVARDSATGDQELVVIDAGLASITLRYGFGNAPYNSIDVGGRFAFSPDGRRIAFGYALEPNGWELVVIDLSTSVIATVLRSGQPNTASLLAGYGIIPTPVYLEGDTDPSGANNDRIALALVLGGAGGAPQYENYVWSLAADTVTPSIGYGVPYSDYEVLTGETVMPLSDDSLPRNDDAFMFGHTNAVQIYESVGRRFGIYHDPINSIVLARFARLADWVMIGALTPGDSGVVQLIAMAITGETAPVTSVTNVRDVLGTAQGFVLLDDVARTPSLHIGTLQLDEGGAFVPPTSVLWSGYEGQFVQLVWAGYPGTLPMDRSAARLNVWTPISDVAYDSDALAPFSGDSPSGDSPAVLVIGGTATIRTTGGDALNMRSAAGTSFSIIEKLSSGSTVLILEGPTESDSLTWWRVQAPSGREGWVVESADGVQTLIAGRVASGVGELDEALEGRPSASLPSALRIGDTAIVTLANPRDSLRLRNAAGLDSRVIVLMPHGTRVTVTDGPQSVGGYTWWQVRTPEGNLGWVVEIVGDERVLIPAP